MKILAWCPICDDFKEMGGNPARCIACGSHATSIVDGKAMHLSAMMKDTTPAQKKMKESNSQRNND